MAANRMVELSFTAEKEHADPFNALDVDVTFTTPASKVIRVPAFWAGGKTWRVRYASPEIGEHRVCHVLHRPGRQGSGTGRRSRAGSSVHGRQSAVPARAICESRQTGDTSSMPMARPSSGSEIPGGWDSASG